MSNFSLWLFVFSFTAAWGQQATIQGVITDPSGAVIPAVKLKVTNRGTSIAVNAETNDQGFYSIPGLVPGGYRVEANGQGFAPSTANLTLNVNQTARLDLVLKVGT